MIKRYAQLLFFVLFFSQQLFAKSPVGRATGPGFSSIPPPVIRSFSPVSGKPGTIVTIHGSHFTRANRIIFDYIDAASFTIISDSIITAVVGTGSSGYVIVQTPSGTGSLAGFVFVPIPGPVITSFSPDTAYTGSTVTIKGSHFAGVDSVSFGGIYARFTVISDSVVTAVVGPGSSGSVAVHGPAGTSALPGFTYVPPVPPVITSFSPDTAGIGTTVTIHGSHFTKAFIVLFGGFNASSYTVLSDTLITAVAGNGGSGSVGVFGPFGLGALPGFTFLHSPNDPIITSFSPDSASGGTAVTIHGSHFTGVNQVRFGGNGISNNGVAALIFNVVSDTLINAVVERGTGSSGPGSVVIERPDGSGSLPGFVYLPFDSNIWIDIHSFSPDSAGTGETVTFHGVNFTHVGTVVFGVTWASSITVMSDTLMTAVVGEGSSGRVTICGPGGYFGYRNGFTFIANPTHLASIPMQLSLYPNPAIGHLQTVSVPATKVASRFELTDLNGRVLKVIPVHPNDRQVQVNTSGFHKGLYKLVWSDGKHTANKTILVP